jgi:hypothetical protein
MSFFSTKHDAAPAAIAHMPDGDHASLGAAAAGRINRNCEPRGHRRYMDCRTPAISGAVRCIAWLCNVEQGEDDDSRHMPVLRD